MFAVLLLALAGDAKGQAALPPAKVELKGQAATPPKTISQSTKVEAEIVREGRIKWRRPRLVITESK
jgi:hypothetical protein